MRAIGVFALMVAAVTTLTGHKLEAGEAPVKAYILAGQSNMVGIGQVSGSSSRWGDEFIDRSFPSMRANTIRLKITTNLLRSRRSSWRNSEVSRRNPFPGAAHKSSAGNCR